MIMNGVAKSVELAVLSSHVSKMYLKGLHPPIPGRGPRNRVSPLRFI